MWNFAAFISSMLIWSFVLSLYFWQKGPQPFFKPSDYSSFWGFEATIGFSLLNFRWLNHQNNSVLASKCRHTLASNLGYIKNSKVCCLWRDPWQNGVGSNVFCWVAGIKLSFLDLVLILRFFLTEERSPNRTKISHVAAGENSRNISNKRKHHKTFLISSKWVLKLLEAKVDFFISGYF